MQKAQKYKKELKSIYCPIKYGKTWSKLGDRDGK